jgi:hypothetical protein
LNTRKWLANTKDELSFVQSTSSCLQAYFREQMTGFFVAETCAIQVALGIFRRKFQSRKQAHPQDAVPA